MQPKAHQPLLERFRRKLLLRRRRSRTREHLFQVTLERRLLIVQECLKPVRQGRSERKTHNLICPIRVPIPIIQNFPAAKIFISQRTRLQFRLLTALRQYKSTNSLNALLQLNSEAWVQRRRINRHHQSKSTNSKSVPFRLISRVPLPLRGQNIC